VAPAALQVIADTASNAGRTAENAVLTTAARMASAAQAAHLSAQAYEAAGGAADGVYRAQALSRAVAAWQNPPLSVTSTASGAVEQGDAPQAEESPYAHASAGIMVQFAMAGLIGAAEIMVVERKSGALRRMLTTPIARWQIILGHFVTMVIMILAQLLILAVFGQLALGVDYSRAPGAIGTMIITTALWSASLGLLIGTFSKSEEQVAMFTIVPMLILSGLGGAWMPLEFTGEAFQAVGHVTPVAWAIDGFENVVIRGMGIGSIWVPAAILLLYTTAFIAIAAWRFRFE
jgi:ABC-2 type transport system permease protein